MKAFAPHVDLANVLLEQLDTAGDGAHDLAHLTRVWKNARAISEAEGGESEILLAAVIFHDCVQIEKNSPMRGVASVFSAARAKGILAGMHWTAAQIGSVAHAIEAHSFSGGKVPKTLEARILQDADRLDAIGHIGIARCFYVAGRIGSALYDPEDVSAKCRRLDDTRYALDHFRTKLIVLGDGFQTKAGSQLAAARLLIIREFLQGFESEVG